MRSAKADRIDAEMLLRGGRAADAWTRNAGDCGVSGAHGPPRNQGKETSRLNREAGLSNGLMRFWRSLRASEIGFQIICKRLRPVCPS